MGFINVEYNSATHPHTHMQTCKNAEIICIVSCVLFSFIYAVFSF